MSTLEIQIPRAFESLEGNHRYKGAYGGRGGAKSHYFAQKMLLRCITRQTRAVCIREIQNSIRDSCKQLLSDKIQSLGLQSEFTILESEIRGKNGSLIIFRGMQSYNASNIKSLENFDIAWVEEAQTLTQHSLDLLRPTIRAPGSELWFGWNPRYKTDAVDKFFRKSPPANAISVFVGWQDNPWFRQTALYDDMKQDYQDDPDKAEHVWGGAYGASQGAILARWVNEADRDGRINDNVSYDSHGAGVVISSDLGYRDTASWWFWQPCLGGANLLYYASGHGWDADDWAPEIQKHLDTLGIKKLEKIWLPHDAKNKTFQSKRTSQQRFQEHFGVDKIGIVPVSRKADQIEAARTFIKRCAFNRELCEDGLDGLRAWEYEYNEDAGVFSKEPLHNWASHPSDAFAYGCQVLMPESKKDETKDKPVFYPQKTLQQIWDEIPAKHKRI